jgi:hypothetical protein
VELVPVLIGIAVCAAAVVIALRLRPSKQAAGKSDRATARVDPFGVGEPWRRHVAAAQSAQRRFAKIVASMSPGPLRSRTRALSEQAYWCFSPSLRKISTSSSVE